MLQQAVYSGGTATPTPSPRLQRKTGYSRPVMPGYMTHVHPQILVQRSREKLTEGDVTLRDSIPAMSKGVAIFCLVLNIVLPGFGTVAAGLSVLCCSQVRPKDDSKRHCIWVNSGVGLLQFVLTFLFLLGWIWSITWGIAFLAVSKQYYYRGHEEPKSRDVEKSRGQAKRGNMTSAAHLRYSPSPSRASSCNSINRITNFETGSCGSNNNSPRQARHNHQQHQHHHHHHHHHHYRDEKSRSNSPNIQRGDQRQKERPVNQHGQHHDHIYISQPQHSLHNNYQDQPQFGKISPKAPHHHHHHHHNHHQHLNEHARLHHDDSDDVAVMPAATDNYASDLNTSALPSSSSSSRYACDTTAGNAINLLDAAVTVISVAEAHNTDKSVPINSDLQHEEERDVGSLQQQHNNHQCSQQELKLNEPLPPNTGVTLAPPFVVQPGCSNTNSQNSSDEIPMQPIIALQRVTSQGGQISPGASPAARAPVLNAPEEKILQAKTRHQIMLQRKLSDNDLSPFELTNKQLAAIVIHDYPVRTPSTPPNSRRLQEETIPELPKV